MTGVGMQAKKKAAPMQAGRPDINNLEGTKMQYQLSTDAALDALEALSRSYGLTGVIDLVTYNGGGKYEAAIHVDARFAHDVSAPVVGHKVRVIRRSAPTRQEALVDLYNAFVEAAPAEKAV